MLASARYLKMLTERGATSGTVIAETADSAIINSFAQPVRRIASVGAESDRVGERQVQVVDKTRVRVRLERLRVLQLREHAAAAAPASQRNVTDANDSELAARALARWLASLSLPLPLPGRKMPMASEPSGSTETTSPSGCFTPSARRRRDGRAGGQHDPASSWAGARPDESPRPGVRIATRPALPCFSA